ncbi:MAG: ATP-binding protein [Desulfobacteraceae bacterium]|jgi:heavy metal sensor kinase
MSLKNRFRLPKTLSLRLTFWYSFIFFFSTLVGFLIFNFLLSSNLYKDLDESLRSEVREIALLIERKGISKVKMAMALETESEGVEKVFIRIMNMYGETLIMSDDTHWKVGPGRKAINSILDGQDIFFETTSLPQRQYKARVLYSRLGKDFILQIMRSREDIDKFIAVFRQIFLITMGFLFIVSTVAGWFMAKRALTGVEEVTQIALQVADGEFDKRVKATGHGEEIERLAITFNNMLEKIQILITDIKEITDNIAHDLRSPVTRIRGIVETTLMTANPDPEYESMAGSIIEECDGLLIMINTMLAISEAEAGVSKLNISDIDLSKIISEACDLFQPIAEDKKIEMKQEMEGNTIIQGDNEKIQRAVANLLDNALKYTPEGGTIVISSKQNPKEVSVSIKDTGIGISEEDLPKIFNRFYRCDESRSLQGVGLGLSLAKAIVRIHHGDIFVSSSPGEGSIFTFTIPRKHLP